MAPSAATNAAHMAMPRGVALSDDLSLLLLSGGLHRKWYSRRFSRPAKAAVPSRTTNLNAEHRGASGARAFSLASCAAGDFFGLLAPVPRLRDHTPAPQAARPKAAGRRRQAPQDRRRLTFFGGGAEIMRSRLWSLKSVLDVLRVSAARPGTRHFRAQHVAGKARSGVSRGSAWARRPFKTL
jgi:hypothetical protein